MSSDDSFEILKRTESSTGRNALHLAVIMDNFKVAEYLVSCGIDCNHIDFYGKKPIDYIVDKKSGFYGLLFLTSSLNIFPSIVSVPIAKFSLEKLFSLQEN